MNEIGNSQKQTLMETRKHGAIVGSVKAVQTQCKVQSDVNEMREC